MLSFRDVGLYRGTRAVLESVSFAVHAGHKVGVVGANGAGKTSLLLLAAGVLEADAGEVGCPAEWTVARVAQETPASDRAAIEHVIDGDEELRVVECALDAARAAGDGAREASLHERLEALDGWTARPRAARLLAGLGFVESDHGRSLAEFSGGWRVRLGLARALMRRSDLLLLDEPTNHLDLDAVLWLEDWLRGYPGTLLLVTHDREFLDPVVDHVLHVEHRRARLHAGDYSTFERRRAEELAHRRVLAERQAREVERMQRFVERFRAKASKARQAQSRLKALARMERIAPAHVDAPFRFSLREPAALPRPLLRAEGAAAGYGDCAVLSRVSLALAPGDRVGLLGRNGAGKSTLVRLLAGALAPRAGRIDHDPALAPGHFAQHLLERLDPQASPLGHLRRLDPEATDQALRDFLGGFGFAGDVQLAPVAPLSGGEKARLALGLLVYARPNLLLLDEPTNHLDLEMRHALALALQEFEGAIVLVSHDRHLLRTVADDLWLVADGRVVPFEGDLDDYARWLRASGRAEGASDTRTASGAPPDTPHTSAGRRERRQEAAAHRDRLRPLRDRMRALERRMENLHREQAGLERGLADPALYGDDRREDLKARLVDKGRVDAQLAATETEWLEAGEELERLEAGDRRREGRRRDEGAGGCDPPAG